MPRSANRTGGGRFRVTDYAAIPVGAEIEVRPEHLRGLNVTKTKEIADETQKAHRRGRIKNIIKWWMTKYPDYFEVKTCILAAEEKIDPMKFFHTCDRDIIYSGLRVDMVLAYVAGTKQKDGDTIYTHSHMREVHDAILFGARTVKHVLSTSYYSEMKSFLNSFKKECGDACSRGNVDAKSSDPISFSLYRLILTWAIEKGNIFVWFGQSYSETLWPGQYQSTCWDYTILRFLKIFM
jgi:hypothetical protein